MFFHYQLKNILKSFKELNGEKINKKVNLISCLGKFIAKVKNNKIKDRFLLGYFYLIIVIEYELNSFLKKLIYNYSDSEDNVSFEDAYISKKENKLYIKNSEIVIDNYDHYDLNKTI